MNIRDVKILIRKSHRYLGVFIGIQVLLWTISGLFFSWTNIKGIRGDHLRADADAIKPITGSISPSEIQSELSKAVSDPKIVSFRIVNVLEKNYFEVKYSARGKETRIALFDTSNGKLRDPISKKEAETIASNSLSKRTSVKETVYLEEDDLGSHHEYREKLTPAWAVSFDHPENLTVYLSAETGQVQSFRTSNWRVFDFLWMLHTMDFIGRDDFNNWVLRIFSALSLLMIFSGFLYFFITAKKPW
ncbi:MAG: hypothetical protein HKN33_06700 [Pyrinomonadaceae bacterium]|nr:hypothetical protein [Pyrinomonadaceae bacterium]